MKKLTWGILTVCLAALGAMGTAVTVCQFKKMQGYVRRAQPLLEQINAFEDRTGRLPADERELGPFAQRPDGPYYEPYPNGGYRLFFVTGSGGYLIWSPTDQTWQTFPAPPQDR